VLQRVEGRGLLARRAHHRDEDVGEGQVVADLHAGDAHDARQARVVELAHDHQRQFLLDRAGEHLGSA
jgi:hypothetical protein